jgi:hypothetical protein
LIQEQKSERKKVIADENLFQRLGSQIIAGGVTPVPQEMARIIHRLADSGLFMAGGVLVGSIAFHILGTHFGVGWENASRTTQDIDLAGEANVKVAVPDIKADVPAVIDSLKTRENIAHRYSHTGKGRRFRPSFHSQVQHRRAASQISRLSDRKSCNRGHGAW